MYYRVQVLLLGFVGAVLAATIANQDEIFKNYLKDFGKTYEGKEYERRREIYFENLKKIEELNAKHPMTTFGETHFTDMSADEFKQRLGGFQMPQENITMETFERTYQAPDSLDYRKKGLVTPVKDQGLCGSCYVFSAIGTIEGQYAKKSGKAVSLSDQQGLDCGKSDCNGGYPIDVIKTLAQLGGSVREQDYPYTAKKGQCKSMPDKIIAKVTGGTILNVADEKSVKEALAQYGPLSFGFYVDNEIQHYTGGVMSPTDCNHDANHAVVLVGYGTDKGQPYWLIKNSWSKTWGEQGYLRLIRKPQLVCGMCDFLYATVA